MFEKLIEPKIFLEEERKTFTNKDLQKLIVPIIIEQFLALLVGIADTLMISYAGESAVSGVSLVNQLNNIFIMIFAALAAGGSVVVSQYIGNKDKKNGTLASSQLIMIITLISIGMTAFILLLGSPIFHLLFGKVENEVYESGMLYLRISAYSFPFLAVYNGCAGLFRSMGKTRELMYVSLVMNLINVIGNAIGIFGLHAGVKGVAYPSLISRIFAAVLMLRLTASKKNPVTIRVKKIFTWDGKMIGRIFGIAIPNSIESGLFQIAKVALSSIVAAFGTIQIAANGVAQSFWSMAALFAIAMGPAFITVIGQYMGAGDEKAAEYYMHKLLRITYVGTVCWNVAFFLLTPFLLKLYSLSDETIVLIILLVLMHNTGNALFCPMSFALSNGLRAAGDVKFTMYSSIFTSVVCRVALSVVFGLWLDWGVIGVTFAMICDWAIKAVLMMMRFHSGKWKNYKIID